MEIKLSYSELDDMLQRAARVGAKNALLELGLSKTTYTRSEIESLYGRTIYKRSLMYVKWTKKGDYKTSPVICQRADFDSWIRKHDIEFKSLKSSLNSVAKHY